MTDQAHLDAAFAALANPTRRAILARLSQGEATVNELAAPFAMSLPAVSKHIRVLENAGFIARGRNAQFRPCAIDAAPIAAIATWADQYRHIWGDRFDKMTQLLANNEDTK
ncbi:transcriptional regulator, ArsR family [Yoonia tamlensis]|uniref:Transcriptional regulator, ArsR family n=1 Tax=Yoonia tamlensis TaxID=390270 RepID=A0A1I6FTP5_9RHOB|nr:metalloregulator ArsR/SmtB family transcription factor [Yoonia tamlensis]SFR33325.1 transcriptional regulator, ArsR family [Yoonia tamlensis]